jgi:hypothetical protein
VKVGEGNALRGEAKKRLNELFGLT